MIEVKRALVIYSFAVIEVLELLVLHDPHDIAHLVVVKVKCACPLIVPDCHALPPYLLFLSCLNTLPRFLFLFQILLPRAFLYMLPLVLLPPRGKK